MDLNLSVFQEPRGVMRIIQFIFSICAFAMISGYSEMLTFEGNDASQSCEIGYPFNVLCARSGLKCSPSSSPSGSVNATISVPCGSDAKFFVATGVLAMLYCMAIVVFYVKFDELYRSNQMIPLADFALSVIFAVLWLSSSAAWAHALDGLKSVKDYIQWTPTNPTCTPALIVPNFSTLTISVILGFLNFFLWGADLWFLYKETAWFQGAQGGQQPGN